MAEKPLDEVRSLPLFWKILRWCAFFLFLYYLAWNLYFLVQGRIPPSILTGATGIPSPTTGGTRSLRALLAGDWRESLRYHPLTVPIIVWFGLSVALPALCLLRRQSPRIPSWVIWGWAVLLGLGWAIKLLSSPNYW